jgi:hypothetical protein
VKRKRRVEFQIEHSEVSIFAGPGAPATHRNPSAAPDSSSPVCAKPEACPTCGSTSMVLLAESLAALGHNLSTLQQRINDGTVHLHRSRTGEWWICTQSLQGS